MRCAVEAAEPIASRHPIPQPATDATMTQTATAPTRRAVALLSGGLDSMLAIRIMQEQGIAVEALSFRTMFTCCQDQAGRAAHMLDVPITFLDTDDDYLDLIRAPQHGYGRGANPCIDCRVYMFRLAGRFMQQVGADFMISGEVVGQRPMSQKKRDLALISRECEFEDLLLRPLSAHRLPPTRPEREGWVDRRKLYGFVGRSRKGLVALAEQFGFDHVPSPSTGCALTEPGFAPKVHDLIRINPASNRWDFELLKIGRHLRFDRETKLVLGRRETENRALVYMAGRDDAHRATLIEPDGFPGPTALLIGPNGDDALEFALASVVEYAKLPVADIESAADEAPAPRLRIQSGGQTSYRLVADVQPSTVSAKVL